MQVKRVDNGLVAELPDDVVRALGLCEGKEIKIRVMRTETVHEPRQETFDDFQRRLAKFRGMLPADFKFDREEANAR